MREILLITSITLHEALRRKVWLWLLVVFGGMLLLDIFIPRLMVDNTKLGMLSDPQKREQGIMVAQHFGSRIAIFFSCIIAIVLAAGQISTEIDRGVLATILPKPLGRWQVLLGKWLGVILFPCFCIVFSLFVNWILCSAMYGFGSGYKLDFAALGVMMIYPMLYATMTIAFSSFSSMVLSLLMTCTLYVVTFVGDPILQLLARMSSNNQMEKLQLLSTWIIPHERLSRWLEMSETSYLETIARRIAGHTEAATLFDKVYVFGYIGVFLLFAMLVFSKRDIN